MAQKTMTQKWRVGVVSLSMLVASLSGCASTLGKAKHAAVVSQQVYTNVEAETVKQIVAIVEKDKNGTITQEDRNRLGLLNDLRKILDKFAGVHNAYVASVKVWETSGKKPSDLDELSSQMLRLVQDAKDLSERLNIKIR